MIKTIVIPQNNNLNLTIPNNYIGKKIEVLLYAKDKLEVEKLKSKKNLLISLEYSIKTKPINLKNTPNKCVMNGTEIFN